MVRVKGQSMFVSSYSYAPLIESEIKKFEEYFNNIIVMKVDELNEDLVQPDFTYRKTHDSMIEGEYGTPVYKFPLSYTMELNENIHLGELSEMSVQTYINSKFRIALSSTPMSHLLIEEVTFEIFDENGKEISLADILAEQKQEAVDAGTIVPERKRKIEVL